MSPASPLLHDLGHACVAPLPRASSGSSLHPSWEDSVTTRSWPCHNWHMPTHRLTTAMEKHRTPCCVPQHPATPGQGPVIQFPHFSKEATPPHALGRQLWCGEGGRGQAGGGQIHTSVHPSVHPPWREGGRFAKPGKIPERRGRAREGPYMGMGTASCFPADVCAAAPAPPPEPPTAPGTPPASLPPQGIGPTAVPRGGGGPRGVQVPAGAQVLPALAQLCPLTTSPPPWGHGSPQQVHTSPIPPHTPQCPHLHIPHIHDISWYPAPITLSTTLYTPPAPLPTPLFLTPPTLPSPFGVFNWGFPPSWARRQLAGNRLRWGAPGGAEQGVRAGPKGVNMGTKGKMLPICSCGTGSRARSHQRWGAPGPQQHLQGRRRKCWGDMQLPAFWGQAYLPTPKYPGGAGVKCEGLQVDKRLLLLYAKPPPHTRPPCRPYNNKPACESAGRLPGRRSPSLGAGPKELCRRPLALAPCTHPPAAHPSASWPH